MNRPAVRIALEMAAGALEGLLSVWDFLRANAVYVAVTVVAIWWYCT